MEAVIPNATVCPSPSGWLREFLKEELAPYPGRGKLVTRMVIAATLVMLITMTYRLPFGYQAIFALTISRETHWATARTTVIAVLALLPTAGYLITGTIFSLGDPMLRMLWVIASLLIGFLGIRIIADYTAASAFGSLVAISIPILDQHISTELKVKQMLWALGVTGLAAIIAALVALLFAGLKPGDFLIRSITERLASVEQLLRCYATGLPVEDNAAKKITRMAMLGTSTLRRNIQRSGYSPHFAEQMGVVVALVGRLVDTAATLVPLGTSVSNGERGRILTLVEHIAGLRADLVERRIPRLSQAFVDSQVSSTAPVLAQMERSVLLINEVLVDTKPMGAHVPALSDESDPPQTLFIRDAFTNPEHIKFALKGCLAAALCYIIYTALDWRGISTAVVTCILTALTTIGSSRQKQILRIMGALAGAAAGLAAQVFVLPFLDSITGFTLLFLVVTSVAAWIATSSPRLSYLGVQLGLAFYVIHLRDFGFERSMVPGRDRVVGIMFGLLMMWLVFDQLWSAPTVVQMREAFVSLVRKVAQLIKQPVSNRLNLNITRSYSLRATISSGFNQVRALADAVWFEFGPSREQDLALRSRILDWQSQLRMLFISGVALVKYRLRFPGFELPEPVRLAQEEFERTLGGTLEGIADRLEGKLGPGTLDLEVAFARLKDSVRSFDSAPAQEALSANLEALLPLSERITGLAVSLSKEIRS